MQNILDKIKAVVLEELGQYDIAAPTLDPRFRLIEKVGEILDEDFEFETCDRCGVILTTCGACDRAGH